MAAAGRKSRTCRRWPSCRSEPDSWEGREVVASSGGGSITVWDVEQRRRRPHAGRRPAHQRRRPESPAPSPSAGPDDVGPSWPSTRPESTSPRSTGVPGSSLWPTSWRGTRPGRELFRVRFENEVQAMAWSPDGEWLAVTDGSVRGPCGGHVTVYDGAGLVAGEVWEVEDVGIGSIRFSPDGRRIVGARYPRRPPRQVCTPGTGRPACSSTASRCPADQLWLSDDAVAGRRRLRTNGSPSWTWPADGGSPYSPGRPHTRSRWRSAPTTRW